MADDPAQPTIEPVVARSEVPAGILGPDSVVIEVRCFLVPGRDGIVIVDTGTPGTGDTIEAALANVGARWSDATDVVVQNISATGLLLESVVALLPGEAIEIYATGLGTGSNAVWAIAFIIVIAIIAAVVYYSGILRTSPNKKVDINVTVPAAPPAPPAPAR